MKLETNPKPNADVVSFFSEHQVEDKIFIEKINILYKNLPLNASTIVVCASLVFFGVRSISTIPYLLDWYLIVLLICLYRYSLLLFHKLYPNRRKLQLVLFILGATSTAASWGIIGSFLMPPDHVGQMIIIIIMAGVAAGAIQSLQVNLAIILIYLALLAFPLCIWLFLQNEAGYFYIFLSMVMYTIFATVSAYRSNRILTRVLKLHFINLTLNENITESNIELQQRNELLARHENDTSVVNKLNKLLQLCQSPQEAYPAIKNAGEELFKDMNAGLTLTDGVGIQHTVVEWGNIVILQPYFPTNNCWALRSGALYKIKASKLELLCHHYMVPPEGTCRCIPLNVSTGVFGMLYFNVPDNILVTNHMKQMMAIFGETIKVGLSRIKLQQELQQQATHDPLTGLYNRRYLNESLERELQHISRDSGNLCVAFFDIDGFKQYNDVYGHEAGDEVLKSLSRIMTNRMRKVDILSRFGGEEFVLVLVNTDIDNVMQILETFRQEFSEMRIYFNESLLEPITVSIGLAQAPQNGATVDDIIRAADNAMYTAKKCGGNQIVIADVD